MGWPKALRHLHRTGKMPRMSLQDFWQHLVAGRIPTAPVWWQTSTFGQPCVHKPGSTCCRPYLHWFMGAPAWNWIHPVKWMSTSKPAAQHKDSPDQVQNEAKCSLNCISCGLLSPSEWLVQVVTSVPGRTQHPRAAVHDPATPPGTRLESDPDPAHAVLQPSSTQLC